MADVEAEIDQLEVELEGLESHLGGVTEMSAAFQRELVGIQSGIGEAGREASTFSRSMNSGLRNAFGDLIFEGGKLSDVLRDIGRSIVNTTFNQALKPVTSAVSGALTSGLTNLISGILPFENGGVFSAGRVVPFAKGGIVSSPTLFPMRGGTGLMGEAGPEAILPLSRGADGSLGVRSGGSSVTVNMSVQTPDVTSFRRSNSQIAAGIQRAIARGQRNN